MSLVNFRQLDKIATLELNDPDHHNRLGRSMIDAFLAALDQFELSDARVLVVRAVAGSSVFSSGHDLNEIDPDSRDPLPEDSRLRFLLRRLKRLSRPTVALVEGAAYGGGVELVMACDLAIATTEASFALTPAKWAIAYDRFGINLALESLPARLVREMLLTAAPISAERAYQFGLINRLVEPGHLDRATDELLGHLAANSPACLAMLKESIRLHSRPGQPTESEIAQIENLRRVLYTSPESTEGITAFHEKRTPIF